VKEPLDRSALETGRQRLWQFMRDAGVFIRFSTLGASIIIALFGAVSVTPSAGVGNLFSGRQLAAIILGAFAFHNFAYVLNDIIDLPLDRTDPRRGQSPLVRGIISPGQGLIFVLLQLLFVFAVTYWLGGRLSAYLALTIAIFFMVIYDNWGKRCYLPPLTDLAQGIGWGCLALWAAALMPGPIAGLTWVLFAYLILFIILINGLHGSFRDLANDYEHGVRTTAIFLGVRPESEGGLFIPPGVRLYAAVLQGALIISIFLPIPGGMLDYPPGLSLLTILVLFLLCLTSWRLMVRSLDAAIYRPQMLAVGTLHLLSLLGMLAALFLFRLPWWLQIIVMAIFFVPILIDTWIRNALRWAISGKGLETLSASDFPSPGPGRTKPDPDIKEAASIPREASQVPPWIPGINTPDR
jgi:4-hydroxybenzoate polyprenyltransferase